VSAAREVKPAEVDALGRGPVERRLLMLETNAGAARRRTMAQQADGRPNTALDSGRLWMLQLMERAFLFAEQARVRELADAEPVVRCWCSKRRAAADKSCLRACCCGGDGYRTVDVAEVDCFCIDDAQVDGDGEDLDLAYDDWREALL